MQLKNKLQILVTSAGTASAVSVIKALQLQKEVPVEIYATDMDPLAAGLHLADHYFISPPASDPAYIPSLISAIEEHHISAIIPIYSKEITIISENSDLLKSAGAGTYLPTPKAIDVCNDKVLMEKILLDSGINLPQSYLKPSDVPESAFPVFFKPNFTSSSNGAVPVHSRGDLERLFRTTDEGIIQELIDGEEVTVDVFCNSKSEPLVIAPRIRLAVKSGQSVKGETVDSKPYEEAVRKICALVEMKGACNIPFFRKGDELTFLEINPRFAAGGLMLTVASGANTPLMVLKSILGLSIGQDECKVKAGMKMTRYWESIIIK